MKRYKEATRHSAKTLSERSEVLFEPRGSILERVIVIIGSISFIIEPKIVMIGSVISIIGYVMTIIGPQAVMDGS